jgi:hypothetical protein
MKKKSILLGFLLLSAFCSSASAALWETPVAQVATISPNEASSFGRLLFRFDLPDQLAGATVDYAELIFTATPDTGNSYICFMGAYPLTKNWEAEDISWSEAWTNAGGDFADSIFSSGLIGVTTNRLTRLDITDMVQMWVVGTSANYGLIVMPLEDSDRFLKLHSNAQLPPNVMAKVRIFYTAPRKE